MCVHMCVYLCVVGVVCMAHFSVSLYTSAGGDMLFLTASSVAAHVFIHCVSS